jgi:hypothetical protein
VINSEKARALRRDLEAAILRYGDFLCEQTGIICTVSVTPTEPEGLEEGAIYQPIVRPVH